jgi:hypothetical protein
MTATPQPLDYAKATPEEVLRLATSGHHKQPFMDRLRGAATIHAAAADNAAHHPTAQRIALRLRAACVKSASRAAADDLEPILADPFAFQAAMLQALGVLAVPRYFWPATMGRT